MSETHNVEPSGSGEGTTAPEPRGAYENDHAAGRALEGLLFADDDTENSEPDEGSNTEPGESPAIRSEDEGQSEPAKPAIDPPSSWSAEDKALFSKLPPEAQAVVARRESERDKAIQQKTQEIANERQTFNAERQAMQTQQGQYIQSLRQLAALAIPELQQLENVDWVKLGTENPAEAVRLQTMRDAARQRIGVLQGELQRATQAQQAEQAKQLKSFMAEQQSKLVERIPEFGDPEKAPKVVNELSSFLTNTYGFTPQEVGSVVDHRLVVLAHDLMRFKQAEAAAKTAQVEKKVNVPPKVQRPGAQQGGDTSESQQVKGLIRNLGRSNNMRDAAKLLETIL